MKAKSTRILGVALVAAAAAAVAGCGEVARGSRSPSQLIISSLEAASGADANTFSTFLLSDVSTFIDDAEGNRFETFFNDPARVTMRMIMRDPGIPGIPSQPSDLNQVTITRYRVTYIRADGRNTPGVDVPHPFDGAVTFTVGGGDEVQFGFNLVRHAAKLEAPLAALRDQLVFVSTIAEVTFYGRDAAGNSVSATGTIGIEFGNFADPN